MWIPPSCCSPLSPLPKSVTGGWGTLQNSMEGAVGGERGRGNCFLIIIFLKITPPSLMLLGSYYVKGSSGYHSFELSEQMWGAFLRKISL